MHVCKYVCMYITHKYTYTYVYNIYIYMCVYIHICIYIYMYVYIHICTLVLWFIPQRFWFRFTLKLKLETTFLFHVSAFKGAVNPQIFECCRKKENNTVPGQIFSLWKNLLLFILINWLKVVNWLKVHLASLH